MVALEYLMVGITANLQSSIQKTLVQRRVNRNKRNRFVTLRFQNRLQAVKLLLLFREDINLVAFLYMRLDILCQQIKLFVE